MSPHIIRCKDSAEMAERAADFIVERAREAVERRGRFDIALSGGSTPEKAYKLLAQAPRRGQVEWAKFRAFFGDERFVPADDDKQSNFAMARRSLLAEAPIPPENVFAFDTTLPAVQHAAVAYGELLVRELGAPPVFDLVLLGMGDDGHTASLFPHAGALDVTGRWVVDTPPGVLPPPVDRMTLTFPAINAARAVLFLIGGEAKAEALRDVLESEPGRLARPSAGVQPVSGDLSMMIDAAAASRLGLGADES